MDAAGKDGTIKHVMSGVNPQGCQVFSFKQPSAEELDHDFLWRYIGACPSAAASASSTARTTKKCWSCACTRRSWRGRSCRRSSSTQGDLGRALRGHPQLRAVLPQRHVILKFFLHVSQEEQKRRFLERLDEPEKNWKFSASDAQEREFWSDGGGEQTEFAFD